MGKRISIRRNNMELEKFLRANYGKSELHYLMCRCLYEIWLTKNYRRFSEEAIIRRKYKRIFGCEPDLEHPKKLSEKIQWLKLNERKDYFKVCADKHTMKGWIAEHFGDRYNVPELFHTINWREVNSQNINQFPCIVKASHTSHDYVILRRKEDVDWRKLQRQCRFWLHRDYAMESQEWQYGVDEPCIVVEALLETSKSKIPNDYKLNFFNGELEFVYVSVDREGDNFRAIYDKDWQPLRFDWDSSNAKELKARPYEVSVPATFAEMKQLGAEVAKYFKYVRVDFYDVDGKLYFGEITLHHGSGLDRMRPAKYDEIYGKKLNLD